MSGDHNMYCSANTAPEAKQEPVAWATTYMGFPNQFFKEDDAEEQAKAEIERLNREYPQDKHKRAARALYTRPAPVNQRIAELEVELMEQARVNGMGGEREAKLMARVERLEALNERLWVALKGYHSNSAKQDWPDDIWIAAEVALREAAIAAAEGKV